ncbi:MAG: hypothetical protein LBQ75_07810 [Zoogloeaceae bacterium]|jgi:predicted transcriptional regulator|nr:hypothetical protein [Zoogloeaceae bacterium]
MNSQGLYWIWKVTMPDGVRFITCSRSVTHEEFLHGYADAKNALDVTPASDEDIDEYMKFIGRVEK